MELTVLGSGTAVPRPERGSPGYLLRGGGRTVLLDPGPGTLTRAAAAGAYPEDIDIVLVTHFHPDHCLDLQALLFALRNPRYEGRRPLEVVAPAGFAEVLDHWQRGVHGPWLTPRGYDLRLSEIGEGEHALGDLRLRAIHVDHTPQSLAWRISERPGGGVLAFSGDTALCDEIVTVGLGADLFVLECAVPDAAPFGKHLTPSMAAEVGERAKPRRLLLTHFYPEVEDEPIREIVAERYAGAIGLAADGDVHRVG